MSYEYDFFFSYKRDIETDAWHEKVKNKLEFWVKKELNQPSCKAFFDTQEIESGLDFQQVIEEDLRRSKCLVAVWSTDYFHSPWCLSELKSFFLREENLGLPRGSLIAPATFHDGKNFPPETQKLGQKDFTPYASTIPAFWQTTEAVAFDRVLQDFAKEIAKKINRAHVYDPTFPVVTVKDDEVPKKVKFSRPADTI